MPYMHAKLNAVATVDASANTGSPVELRIYAVPHGCQVDKNGVIRHADGSEASAEETAFEPFKATPDILPALPSPEPAPAELELEAEDDDKIELLAAHRRRRDDDDSSSGAA